MPERHARSRTNSPTKKSPNGRSGREEAAFSTHDPCQKLRQLKDQFGPEGRWDLIQRYEFGLATRTVYDAQTGGGASRRVKFFPTLSDALDLDERLLWHVARFAKSFKRPEVEKLARTTLSNGQPLTWSHVRRLLEVLVLRKRDELLRETVQHSWTSEQLAHAIQQSKGGKKNKGGRRPNAPKGLQGVIASSGGPWRSCSTGMRRFGPGRASRSRNWPQRRRPRG